MNYFEQELRRLAKACGGIINPTFAGRVCYGDLGGDNRVKLQFVDLGTYERYEALKATVLNRQDGVVDSLRFRFADTWGKKQVSNPNFKDGVIPYIWTYNGQSEWYAYRPTDADIKQLAAKVSGYLAVFTDRSLTPEKSHVQTGEKESVTKKLREANKNPAPRKASAKKHEPEL